VGLINDLTDVISKSLDTNMKSINVSSDSGMFEGILTIFVSNLDHLDKIIQRIRKVDGVKMAVRYE
jgi:GTP pyrophosphokinase/guanosine-3',5'-bis(diphosphate) 3'-pyrophosphohydrolase